jgi:hypothetical protein
MILWAVGLLVVSIASSIYVKREVVLRNSKNVSEFPQE